MRLEGCSGTIKIPSLKLTAKAPENGGPVEKEIPNLETSICRGLLLLVLGNVYLYPLLSMFFLLKNLDVLERKIWKLKLGRYGKLMFFLWLFWFRFVDFWGVGVWSLGKTIQIEEGRIMCLCFLCFKWMAPVTYIWTDFMEALWGTHISQKQGWFHHKGISKELWAPCLCTWCQIPNQQQVQVWSATGTSWQCTYDMTSWFLCRNWSSLCRPDVRVIRAPYANLVSAAAFGYRLFLLSFIIRLCLHMW